MRNWLAWIFVASVVALSALFAGMNSQLVQLDLHFWVFELPAGLLVLTALWLGCMVGGAALWFGVILPLRIQLARLRRRSAAEQRPIPEVKA